MIKYTKIFIYYMNEHVILDIYQAYEEKHTDGIKINQSVSDQNPNK